MTKSLHVKDLYSKYGLYHLFFYFNKRTIVLTSQKRFANPLTWIHLPPWGSRSPWHVYTSPPRGSRTPVRKPLIYTFQNMRIISSAEDVSLKISWNFDKKLPLPDSWFSRIIMKAAAGWPLLPYNTTTASAPCAMQVSAQLCHSKYSPFVARELQTVTRTEKCHYCLLI